jgi:hypothetical protein
MDNHVRIAELYVKALRTGEASATAQIAQHLAPDVVLDTVGAHMWGNGSEHFEGYDAVLNMVTGIGVMTGVYRTGAWANPEVSGDQVRVTADLGGGLLSTADLVFTFNADGKIAKVQQVNKGGTPAPQTDKIPDFVKAIVNAALANNTPLIVAYTGDDGAPVLTMRGSTMAYSDTQLSIWVRHANGGMANTLRKNPKMTLMYRDPPARATLTFQGRGYFNDDPDVRNRVFELMPEVEQRHDLERNGAALIIDVDRVTGSSPRGGVRMVRQSQATPVGRTP